MRPLNLLACISAASLLAACATQSGYYDANGNYIPPANHTTDAQRVHSPAPGGTGNTSGYYVDRTDRVYNYDRRGYYDYNGYYIADVRGMGVPNSMFPPRGMCRAWFPDRVPADQPNIESCNGINSRVPAGAYVIYGG